MQCEVGLCPKCVSTSAIRDHVGHQILEVREAFEVLRKRCASLVEKGKETSAVLQAKSTKISDSATALLDTVNSNSLNVFAMMKDFSDLVTTQFPPHQTRQNKV